MSPESHFPRQHDTNTSAPYCNSRGKHMKYDVVATATVVVGISLLPGAQSHLALAMQFLQTLFMVQPLHTKKDVWYASPQNLTFVSRISPHNILATIQQESPSMCQNFQNFA